MLLCASKSGIVPLQPTESTGNPANSHSYGLQPFKSQNINF